MAENRSTSVAASPQTSRSLTDKLQTSVDNLNPITGRSPAARGRSASSCRTTPRRTTSWSPRSTASRAASAAVRHLGQGAEDPPRPRPRGRLPLRARGLALGLRLRLDPGNDRGASTDRAGGRPAGPGECPHRRHHHHQSRRHVETSDHSQGHDRGQDQPLRAVRLRLGERARLGAGLFESSRRASSDYAFLGQRRLTVEAFDFGHSTSRASTSSTRTCACSAATTCTPTSTWSAATTTPWSTSTARSSSAAA